MKKLRAVLIIFAVIIQLTSCSSTMVSDEKYNEISDYVLENIEVIPTEKEIEFFDYETTGLSIGGVCYGYYYSAEDSIVFPDFYAGNDIDKIKNNKYEADGGVFFGKPNSGTDWCYIKKITQYWYYYELHSA